MRMREQNPVKKLTLLRPEGSRRAGRPKLRWLDGVEEDLRTLRIRGWRRRALDRNRWKKVLTGGCNVIIISSSAKTVSCSWDFKHGVSNSSYEKWLGTNFLLV